MKKFMGLLLAASMLAGSMNAQQQTGARWRKAVGALSDIGAAAFAGQQGGGILGQTAEHLSAWAQDRPAQPAAQRAYEQSWRNAQLREWELGQRARELDLLRQQQARAGVPYAWPYYQYQQFPQQYAQWCQLQPNHPYCLYFQQPQYAYQLCLSQPQNPYCLTLFPGLAPGLPAPAPAPIAPAPTPAVQPVMPQPPMQHYVPGTQVAKAWCEHCGAVGLPGDMIRLKCGHTICPSCAARYVRALGWTCPICGKPVSAGEEWRIKYRYR